MRRIRVALLLLVLLVCSYSCSWLKPRPPLVTLQIDASSQLNPDEDGRPSPVVMRVYQLTSDNKFKEQGFFALYEQANDVLAETLIKIHTAELDPAGNQQLEIKVSPLAKHLGFIIAFRHLEQATWRYVIPVEKLRTQYKKVEGKYNVFLRLQENDFAFLKNKPMQ